MSCNWPLVALEQLTDKIAMGPFGANIKVETFVPSGVPIISGAHLKRNKLEDLDFNFITHEHANKLKNSIVIRGDVVFTHAGTIGQVALIPESSKYKEYILSQRQFFARCNLKLLLPEFLMYYFKSSDGLSQLLTYANQTGVPSISRPVTSLKLIKIPLPSISEQRSIASILSSLDDKIELNNRMNKTLEEIAQTLFKRWFVDFEFPDENGNPYKSSGGKMVESEIGMIPEGWKVCLLNDIVDVLSGGTPLTKVEEYWNGDIPFFTPKDCSVDLFSIRTEKYITIDGLKKCNSRLYPENMIFITARGTVGKTCLAGLPMAMNQSCFALRSKSLISQQSMILFVRNVIDQINNSASGAVFDAINIATFNYIKTIIPDDHSIIESFNVITSSLFSQILLLTQQSQILSQMRDTILPKLMSGEIRVPY